MWLITVGSCLSCKKFHSLKWCLVSTDFSVSLFFLQLCVEPHVSPSCIVSSKEAVDRKCEMCAQLCWCHGPWLVEAAVPKVSLMHHYLDTSGRVIGGHCQEKFSECSILFLFHLYIWYWWLSALKYIVELSLHACASSAW